MVPNCPWAAQWEATKTRDRTALASCTGVQVCGGGMTSVAIGEDWVPAACTLPTAEQPLRRQEFADVFASVPEPVEWISDREIRFRLPAALVTA